MNNLQNLPMVVIFGRTNVGKSTLFNRLTEKNQAIVADFEGTTRDSNIGKVSWKGKTFNLIDTGGILDLDYLISKKVETNDIEAKVQSQARDYLKKASLILFLVDSKTGILPHDRQMAIILKKILSLEGDNINKILLVANKADGQKDRDRASEFYKLSLGTPTLISSISGSGTGDLLDIIYKKIKKGKEKNSDKLKENIKVCIIGKPNVGKSSLLNKILGYERVIVSPMPHTTREPQDTIIEYLDTKIKLIDTAGISKKAQLSSRKIIKGIKYLEKAGIEKTLYILKKADIVLFIIDINEEITKQDSRIVEELINYKKSLIIIANKWDKVENKDTKKFTNYIYAHLPFVTWAPIQFISAKTGSKINKILDLILDIYKQRKIEIPDNELNTLLMKIIKMHKPSKAKGEKHPYIYKFRQLFSNPPKFEVRIGAKDTLHFSYVRFMENRLREKYGFLGTPLSVIVIKNKFVHGRREQDK